MSVEELLDLPQTLDEEKCVASDDADNVCCQYTQMNKNTVDAKCQLKPSEFVHFFNFEGKGKRVMFMGNSITLHGVKPDIGWFHEWGMAASAAENDYVHRLMSSVREKDPDAAFCICQISEWERQYKSGKDVYHLYDNARDFNADIMVMRAVENCPGDDFDKRVFKQELKNLLEYLNPTGKAKIILTTGFWHHPGDVGIGEMAKEMNLPLVRLGDLGEMEEMMAIGLFEHSGVAIHPGDLGMKEIANRIFESLKEYL